MARLYCQTRVEGRITSSTSQRGYDSCPILSTLGEIVPRASMELQELKSSENNERGPKEKYIRLKCGTAGLPKGLLFIGVLGDRVSIVSAKDSNNPSRNLHTMSVMRHERKVTQFNHESASLNLATGRDKLTRLFEASKKGKVQVWQLMLDPEMYELAYESIKGKKGALTPGVGVETLDSFSRRTIDKTIETIKNHTFKFSPIRRVFIPKKNGNLRPLGIPGPVDKVVQKVMAIILEAIYDHEKSPVFKDTSHGFRRGRSTHTALKYISHRTGTD